MTPYHWESSHGNLVTTSISGYGTFCCLDSGRCTNKQCSWASARS